VNSENERTLGSGRQRLHSDSDSRCVPCVQGDAIVNATNERMLAAATARTPRGGRLLLPSTVRKNCCHVQGDAIVNAANKRMLGGGGVDDAIHRAAGGGLRDACARYPAPAGVRCPEGHARITEGCELPAQWVIHTVGPMYESDEVSEPVLRLAYMCARALVLLCLFLAMLCVACRPTWLACALAQPLRTVLLRTHSDCATAGPCCPPSITCM
jgi:Macro domain